MSKFHFVQIGFFFILTEIHLCFALRNAAGVGGGNRADHLLSGWVVSSRTAFGRPVSQFVTNGTVEDELMVLGDYQTRKTARSPGAAAP
jgi:hypothetical protein